MKIIITESQHQTVLLETISTYLRRRMSMDVMKGEMDIIIEYHMLPCEFKNAGDFVAEACDMMTYGYLEDLNVSAKDTDSFYYHMVDLFKDYLVKVYNKKCGKKLRTESVRKIIITESQYKKIMESEEDEVLHIPSLKYFNNNWDLFLKFLESEGNPLYSLGDDLDLRYTQLYDNFQGTNEALGNLTSVGGNLDLYKTPVESLGNLTSVGGNLDLGNSQIKSLENLTSVGGDLDLSHTQIESLGNLTSVGGDLGLYKTPIAEKYSKKEIRQIVDVGGNIYLK